MKTKKTAEKPARRRIPLFTQVVDLMEKVVAQGKELEVHRGDRVQIAACLGASTPQTATQADVLAAIERLQVYASEQTNRAGLAERALADLRAANDHSANAGELSRLRMIEALVHTSVRRLLPTLERGRVGASFYLERFIALVEELEQRRGRAIQFASTVTPVATSEQVKSMMDSAIAIVGPPPGRGL